MLAIAQDSNKVIESFYDKYKAKEDVTHIKLKGWVINLAAKFADDEDAKRVLKKISKLRVLVMEDGNIVNDTDRKILGRALRTDDFEDLVYVRDGETKISIKMREHKGVITNVFLTVDDPDGFILLSLEGELLWKDLQELEIDVEGAEHLKKIPKNRPRA